MQINELAKKLLIKLKFIIFSLKNQEISKVIRKVKAEKLTYLDIEVLCDLVQVAVDNEKNNLEGIIIETGCALGGSSIALAAAKSPKSFLR